MRILGVDPALTVTGYGLIESIKSRLFIIEAGVVITNSKKNIQERLDKIHRCILKLINESKPDVMVLEKLYAHYRHPVTAYLLGQARGVICLACAKGNIPLVEYAATRVKKAIIGTGLASKYQVQRMVVNILNLRSLPKYTDVTDALALAVAHSYISKIDRIKIDRIK